MKTTIAIAAALAAAALLPAARADETTPVYDWGIVYYMSYDNNLEKCGQPIIEMIRKGVTTEKTVAAVQADFSDAGGMHRYSITSKGMSETRVESENSADEAQVIEYLEWFVKTYPCKKYVVTFLDHGGKLDDMCADDKPGPGGKKWMSGRLLGEKLRAFKAKMAGKWELLFLQQCGRGSLENLYSFRGTADFVMSSPVPVGAPNTYYTQLHEWIAKTADATGDTVAAKIAEFDEDYTIYTCLRTSKLDELPKRLDAALAPLLKRKALAAPAKQRPIHPVGEPIVDAATYLAKLAEANGAGQREVAAFFTWTKTDLFTLVKFEPKSERMKDRLCGLSIYAAGTAEEAKRYKSLELYGACKLGSLWEKLLAKDGAKTFSQ